MPNEMFLDWIDEDGQSSRSRWWTAETNPANVADLIAALAGGSEAAILRYGILLNDTPDVAIASAASPYNVHDKAVLEFLDSNGNVAKLSWANPSPAIFTGDDEIDLANAQVVSLVAAAQALLRTNGGETFGAPLRGYRTRNNRTS